MFVCTCNFVMKRNKSIYLRSPLEVLTSCYWNYNVLELKWVLVCAVRNNLMLQSTLQIMFMFKYPSGEAWSRHHAISLSNLSNTPGPAAFRLTSDPSCHWFKVILSRPASFFDWLSCASFSLRAGQPMLQDAAGTLCHSELRMPRTAKVLWKRNFACFHCIFDNGPSSGFYQAFSS